MDLSTRNSSFSRLQQRDARDSRTQILDYTTIFIQTQKNYVEGFPLGIVRSRAGDTHFFKSVFILDHYLSNPSILVLFSMPQFGRHAVLPYPVKYSEG